MTQLQDNAGYGVEFTSRFDRAIVNIRQPVLKRRLRRYIPLITFVIIPVCLAAFYYFVIAADQFESETAFAVRSNQSKQAFSLLGQVLNSSAIASADSEQFGLGEYLKSHDAVEALSSNVNLVDIFRRPEADVLARLWYAHPTKEDLLDYYRRQVTVNFDSESGLTKLTVRAFRADDAYKLSKMLLDLGEARVNEITQRAEQDGLKVAEQHVESARSQTANIQAALTQFRIKQQAVDPEKSVTTLLTVIGNLENQLAETRAQLSTAAYLKSDSPQYIGLNDRIRALENQIADQKSRLTGKGGSLSGILSEYEQLNIQRQFADREYASALASLETARIETMKQHLFVVEVVKPNLPDDSRYPKRYLTVLTVLISLLVAYSIGWLIMAGVREHAA